MNPRRWIVVADSPFLPARDGGQREHLGLVRAAHEAGVLALLVVPAPQSTDLTPYREAFPGTPVVTSPLRSAASALAHPRLPAALARRPAPPALSATARELAPDADALVLSSFKSRRVGERLALDLGLPAVLRMHNREGLYHRDAAAARTGPAAWLLGRDAALVEAEEQSLQDAGWLAGIADISASDARWREAHSSLPVAHVPPFAVGVHGPRLARPDEAAPVALFLGALDVSTNRSAVTWLLHEVWPQVRLSVPGAELVVAGRSPGGALAADVGAAPGARLVADPPEVAPLLAGARVAVNPAVSGSGVNIKLVEYVVAGLPVVTTSRGCQGLPFTASDLAVRDDPREFADALSQLLCDAPCAAALGARGRAAALRLLDPARGIADLTRLLSA